jgi:hypothetical protein
VMGSAAHHIHEETPSNDFSEDQQSTECSWRSTAEVDSVCISEHEDSEDEDECLQVCQSPSATLPSHPLNT